MNLFTSYLFIFFSSLNELFYKVVICMCFLRIKMIIIKIKERKKKKKYYATKKMYIYNIYTLYKYVINFTFACSSLLRRHSLENEQTLTC